MKVALISIDSEICKGCGLCVRACPKRIVNLSQTRLNSKGYHPAEVMNTSDCIACKACALTCPDVCIRIEK